MSGITSLSSGSGVTVVGTPTANNVTLWASSSSIKDSSVLSIDSSSVTTITGQILSTFTGAVSAATLKLSGTPYAAGSGTTNKPLLLLEDSGTSTGWGAGTYIGVNAITGSGANALDLQYVGVSQFKVVAAGGALTTLGSITLGGALTSTNGSQLYIRGAGNNAQLRLFAATDLTSLKGSFMDDTGNLEWWGGWKGNYTQPPLRLYVGTEGAMVGKGNQASSPIAPYQLVDVRGVAGAGKTVYSNTATGAADATHGFEVGVDAAGQAVLQTNDGGIIQIKGAEATGAGTPLLGTNSPAVTNTAPYTWLKFKSLDGSTVYVAAYK